LEAIKYTYQALTEIKDHNLLKDYNFFVRLKAVSNIYLHIPGLIQKADWQTINHHLNISRSLYYAMLKRLANRQFIVKLANGYSLKSLNAVNDILNFKTFENRKGVVYHPFCKFDFETVIDEKTFNETRLIYVMKQLQKWSNYNAKKRRTHECSSIDDRIDAKQKSLKEFTISLDQLRYASGISSKTVVDKMIDSIIKKGLLKRRKNRKVIANNIPYCEYKKQYLQIDSRFIYDFEKKQVVRYYSNTYIFDNAALGFASETEIENDLIAYDKNETKKAIKKLKKEKGFNPYSNITDDIELLKAVNNFQHFLNENKQHLINCNIFSSFFLNRKLPTTMYAGILSKVFSSRNEKLKKLLAQYVDINNDIDTYDKQYSFPLIVEGQKSFVTSTRKMYYLATESNRKANSILLKKNAISNKDVFDSCMPVIVCKDRGELLNTNYQSILSITFM